MATNGSSKQCTKCKLEKPLSQYNKRNRSKDGRRAECRECQRADRAKYYASNPDARRDYYRNNRDIIRARRAEHYAQPEVRRQHIEYCARYYAENKERARARKAEHYANNRDRILAADAEYKAANPHVGWEAGYRERAKQYGFEPVIESFTKDDLIARWGPDCWHCGGPFEQLDHHPVPVVHGGAHTLNNAKPSCGTCNAKGCGVRRLNQNDIGETA